MEMLQHRSRRYPVRVIGRRLRRPLVISGERLCLRDFVGSDFESVHSYATDREVVRFMEWGPNSAEATLEFLTRACSCAAETPRRQFELAVTMLDTGLLIGGIGIHTSGSQGMLGYCFARSAWGQGYATEAARLGASFAFGSLGLHRVWARCDSENEASIRVLVKLGLRREGLAKNDCQIRGEWRNTFTYAILADEWGQYTG